MSASEHSDSHKHHHHHHHHHRQHRPDRLFLTPSRLYPTPSYSSIPFSPSPAPTPSKQRRRTNSSPTSLSSIFLLLFSLRSLYSLLPFLRSSPPSFSLFPFSFLVALLSFFLSLILSSSSSNDSPRNSTISSSLLRPLFAKSSLLALVFLLRYQALRSCGTAATILADFSGTLAAKSLSERRDRVGGAAAHAPFRGFAALLLGLLLLSLGWDRIGCLPLSAAAAGASLEDSSGGRYCARILPMLLPFLAGFLAFFERASANWGAFRQLGRRQVRLFSLFLTAVILFFPACISFLFSEGGYSVSVGSLGWPLVNTVVFGVILSESYGDDKSMVYPRDLRKDFMLTFSCTLVLELFYFEELELFGFLLCGFLLWLAVRDLSPGSSNYPELGSGSSDTLSSTLLSAIRHIFSERRSRKIALFLLINTAYMVVEFVAGFMSNSLGLISDACHMLFDCAALAIGLYASYISRLPVNSQFSYGRGRFEVLSGYVNAVLLVLVGALIVLESIERILDPQEISTTSLLAVSIGGLVVNVVGLIFFHEEHHHAHGGSGSCSHAHSHHHHHHHHHHHSHDHCVDDSKHHQQAISITHEASHGRSHSAHELEGLEGCSDHHGHDQHHCQHHHNQDDQAVGPCKSHDDSDSQHGLRSYALPHDTHDDHIHDHGQGHDHDFHHTHCHEHQCHSDGNDHSQLNKHDSHEGHDHTSGSHSNLTHGFYQHNHHNPDHGSHQSSGDLQNLHSHITASVSLDAHSHDVHVIHDNSLKHRGDGCKKDHENPSCILNHATKSECRGGSLEEKVHVQPQKHHHMDHNMEGIFLHVLADTMGSVGVVISTLLIRYKGWLVADPACSIFISVLIVSSVISLLRNSAEILLQRVPRVHEQELKVALDEIMRIKGIRGIQNVHVWSLTNTDVVGTVHLHVSEEIDKVSAKEKVSHILSDVGIKDLTLQVE